VTSHFGCELRFKARVFDGGIHVRDQVFGHAAA